MKPSLIKFIKLVYKSNKKLEYKERMPKTLYNMPSFNLKRQMLSIDDVKFCPGLRYQRRYQSMRNILELTLLVDTICVKLWVSEVDYT
jgi:hypothetical protein